MSSLSQQPQASQNATSQPTTQIGSETQTQTQALSSSGSQAQSPVVLRLRGAHASGSRSVRWADDVVNNEGLGRKSSKVCCIYHRPRGADESSDDDSDSDSSDSTSDSEGGGRGDAKEKNHAHDCGGHKHHHGRRKDKSKREAGGGKRKPSPNEYERIPRQKPRDDAPGSRQVPNST